MNNPSEARRCFSSEGAGAPRSRKWLSEAIGFLAAVTMVWGCSATAEYTRAQPSYFICADAGQIAECTPPPVAQSSATAQPAAPATDGSNYPVSDIFSVECTYAEKTPFWQEHTINPLTGTVARSNSNPTCLYKTAYINRLKLDDLDGQIVDMAGSKKADSSAPTKAADAGAPKAESSTASSPPTPTPIDTGATHQRDETVAELLQISDRNCNTFLSRAFSNSAGLSFARGMISAVTSAAAAVTGFASVPAASALSATNIGAGDSVDAFNDAYYAKQTFQAVEKAIRLQRAKIKDRIVQCETSECPADSAEEDALDALTAASDAQQACQTASTAVSATQDKASSAAGTAKGTAASKSLDSLSSTQNTACTAADQASDEASKANDASQTAKASSPPKSSPPGVYLLIDALNDVQDYDNQCSLNSGLISLGKVVDAASTNSTNTTSTSTSTDPTVQKNQAEQHKAKATAAAQTAKAAATKAKTTANRAGVTVPAS